MAIDGVVARSRSYRFRHKNIWVGALNSATGTYRARHHRTRDRLVSVFAAAQARMDLSIVSCGTRFATGR